MDEISTGSGRTGERSVSGRGIEEILASVKYTDFYKAMSQDDCDLCGLSTDDYGIAVFEFKKRMDIKVGPLEKQIAKIDIDVTLISNCLIYMPVLGLDEKDIEILTSVGVEVGTDLQKVADSAQEKLNALTKKRKLLSGELPKLKNVIKTTGQDMVADLSLGIEIGLPMDLNLLEYISYYRSAKKKNDSMKRATNKPKHGNRR